MPRGAALPGRGEGVAGRAYGGREGGGRGRDGVGGLHLLAD